MKIDWEKFGFNYSQPQRLTQSRWVQNDKVGKGYLIFKLILASFWLILIIIDLCDNSLKSSNPTEGAKYLLYATRWGALLMVLTTVYDAILVSLRYFDERKRKSKYDDCSAGDHFTEMNIGLKIGWILSVTSYSCSFFVTVIYWAFLFDYKRGVEGVAALSVFINLSEHLLQSVTAITDTWISGRPFRIQHFWCPLLAGLIYIIFNVIYIVPCQGTDVKGRDWIYPVLKWNESPGLSMAFVVGAGIIVPILHSILYGITRLRDWIWSRMYFDPENEMIDGVEWKPQERSGIENPTFRRVE